jgi:hypothetical protein
MSIYSNIHNLTLFGRDSVPFKVYSNDGRAIPAHFFWATRVQPNSRLVDKVLSAASQRIGTQFKKGLSGYQGKLDPEQMYEDIRKVYKTI